MNEVIIDGVAYVWRCCSPRLYSGDLCDFWDQFDEKKHNEIRRRMTAYFVEAGHFMRKEDFEKRHGVYEKDDLFYGL
ncbi:MAG: hypothetical protein LBL45_00160 [Treponema sp.]|jgi:hypothetical protein|nr:hypothetical protein [Treponema sp.]